MHIYIKENPNQTIVLGQGRQTKIRRYRCRPVHFKLSIVNFRTANYRVLLYSNMSLA